MRALVWVLLGAVGIAFWSAMASRLSVGYAFPDAAVVTVCFLALRKEPVFVAVVALALGYLSGRGALAPVGVHETALVITAVGTYMAAGQLTAGGPVFCAFLTGGATMAYHVLLYVILWWGQERAGFSSWMTALLLPSATLTGLLAFFCYPILDALDRRLHPVERAGGLGWD